MNKAERAERTPPVLPLNVFTWSVQVGTALKWRFRMVSTVFVQSQDPGVKKWDLCSKHGGFALFSWRPKINEKKYVAKTQRWISFKPGFGEYL